MELKTTRLILRPFSLNDFEAMHEFASDLQNVEHMDWGPNTEEQSRSFLREVQDSHKNPDPGEYNFAVTVGATGQLIGSASIWIESKPNKRGGFGYILNKKFWRKGYGEETAQELLRFGFQDLRLHRVAATCAPSNAASKGLLEKIGMHLEGHLRQNIFHRDAWRDSLLFSILDSEWKPKA